MNLNPFAKKKMDDEEFDELEESPRKIKDIKPENRKKRTEPVKPWGKFERYTVLFALLITVLTALILILYSKGLRLPTIKFNDLNLFEEKTIIVN